jgi:hypothetical protein
VSFLFVANVSAAFYGLKLIDVPLFLCVRRLTSLCVLVTEFIVLGKVSSRPVLASILLVMCGTVLAGYESLSSYLVGYVYVMANNILTALLYTWVRGAAARTGARHCCRLLLPLPSSLLLLLLFFPSLPSHGLPCDVRMDASYSLCSARSHFAPGGAGTQPRARLLTPATCCLDLCLRFVACPCSKRSCATAK